MEKDNLNCIDSNDILLKNNKESYIVNYINKYFKVNFNSNRSFVYSIIPIVTYKFNNLDLTKFFKEMLKFDSVYYEYDFENLKECNHLVLDKNKCIISNNLKYFLFYDKERNKLNIGDELSCNLDKDNLGLHYINREYEEIKEFYTSKLDNPSEGYEEFISLYIKYWHGDGNPSIFNNLSDKERNVILDICIDLGSYNCALYSEVLEYVYESRALDYLIKIDECPVINSYFKDQNKIKMFILSKDLKYFNDCLKIYQNHESSRLRTDCFTFLDEKHFLSLIYEALNNKYFEERRDAFNSFLKYYDIDYRFGYGLKNENDRTLFQAYEDISNHIIKNRRSDYDLFLKDLFKIKNETDFRQKIEYFLDEYSDILTIEDILKRFPEAQMFSLKRNALEMESYDYDSLSSTYKEFSGYYKVDKSLDDILNDPELRIIYNTIDEFYEKNSNRMIGSIPDDIKNKDLLEKYLNVTELLGRYLVDLRGQKMFIYNYYHDCIKDEVLKDNLIKYERVINYGKILNRIYYFKLNEDTIKYLINKKRINANDELVDLCLYKDGIKVFEYYIVNV